MKLSSTILKTSAVCLMALGTISVLSPNANAKRGHHRRAHKRVSVITSWQGGAYPGRWVKYHYHHHTHYYWHIKGDRYESHHGNWYPHRRATKKRHKAKKRARQDSASQMESQTLRSINKDRAKHHVKKLSRTNRLNRLARMRANELARMNHLTHFNRKGRLRYVQDARRNHIRLGGYNGENIASAGLGRIQMDTNPHIYSNSNGNDMAKMTENEMVYHDGDSQWGHRKNMLNRRYKTVGISVKQRRGTNNYYLAENFSS